MGNTSSALRDAITEELRLLRARQDFASALFFPGKPVEHEKEPNEQDRNMLGHLGLKWEEEE
jgi:hypothetical protein